MRDKDTKKRSTRISPHAGEANTGIELSEAELKEVTGGKVTMQDFSFTMKMNKSSPSWRPRCAIAKLRWIFLPPTAASRSFAQCFAPRTPTDKGQFTKLEFLILDQKNSSCIRSVEQMIAVLSCRARSSTPNWRRWIKPSDFNHHGVPSGNWHPDGRLRRVHRLKILIALFLAQAYQRRWRDLFFLGALIYRRSKGTLDIIPSHIVARTATLLDRRVARASHAAIDAKSRWIVQRNEQESAQATRRAEARAIRRRGARRRGAGWWATTSQVQGRPSRPARSSLNWSLSAFDKVFGRFESQLILIKISKETPRYPHILSLPAATNCSFMPQSGRTYGTERI
jgi:hypothetical protein